MLLRAIIRELELLAPLSLQESYDNSGLIIGNMDSEITAALVCLDVTESVLDEAIATGCNLVISHHPMVFTGIKKLTNRNQTERLVSKAIKNDLNVYAIHTNLDNVHNGVNAMLSAKIGIKNPQILRQVKGSLGKLVTFCPQSHVTQVRQALFDAGAGRIGNYSECSFNTAGQGTFKAGSGANPFVGELQKLHVEDETKIEMVFPVHLEKQLIKALLAAHPYEEVAYDIHLLQNTHPQIGAGMIGELQQETIAAEFLHDVKKQLSLPTLRYTGNLQKPIKKVAVCGGSGSFLIPDALAQGADCFLTGDLKYHDFFSLDNQMIITDIGHYESEQFTKELIYNVVKEKFRTFAISISKNQGNPINYL